MTRSFIGTARQKKAIKLQNIRTDHLTAMIDAQGVSSVGTDYGPILSELEDELNRRRSKQSERHERQALSIQERILSKAPSEITCSTCTTVAKIEDAAALFYRDPRKSKTQPNTYRTQCKECMKIDTKERTKIKNINEKELPF
jgi:hypothetical protein